MIRKNEWITKLELESISRKVLQKEKDIEIKNNDNTGEQFYQDWKEYTWEWSHPGWYRGFRREEEEHDKGYIRLNQRQQ